MCVIITGASAGIGRSLVFAFAKEGYDVVLVGRNLDRLHCVESEIKTMYDVRTLCIETDVTVPGQVVEMVNRAVESFNRIDILINNAGIGHYDLLENSSVKDLRRVMETNYFGVLNCILAALPYLKKTKGTIINISSVAGVIPAPYIGGYCASKYAVKALTDTLRIELHRQGVKVMGVYPGPIRTGFAENALGSQRELFQSKDNKVYPWNSPDRLAKVVLKGFRRKKREVIFPLWYRIPLWIHWIAPRLYDFLAMRLGGSPPYKVIQDTTSAGIISTFILV